MIRQLYLQEKSLLRRKVGRSHSWPGHIFGEKERLLSSWLVRLFWVHIPVLRCFSPRREGVGRCVFTITIPVSGPSDAFVHSSQATKYLAWLGFVSQPQVHLQVSAPMYAEEHVVFRLVVSDHACATFMLCGQLR
jgi:hypothetical protein